jgi:F0F1-type ATP synthase assembly protein I
MEQTVFETAGQQIDDTTHKAIRAASAIADAVKDGVSAARRRARDGAEAATELLYTTKRRMQRHPLEIVAITFVTGIAAGAAIGWMIRRTKVTKITPSSGAKEACR